MKIVTDPMPAYRAGAVAEVNARFVQQAANVAMQESVWRRKREIAEAVQAGGDVALLAPEAALRGLSVAQLVTLILSKPDPATLSDARELRRQTALLAIDAAKSPAELDAILAGLK